MNVGNPVRIIEVPKPEPIAVPSPIKVPVPVGPRRVEEPAPNKETYDS